MIRRPKFVPLWIFFFLCIVLNGTIVYGETPVSGNIMTDTTWTKGNSPYIVTGTVQVYPDITLTIEPGVVIKFNQGAGLKIGGKLIAQGQPSDLIVFTEVSQSPTTEDFADKIEFTPPCVSVQFDENGNYLNGSILENCKLDFSEKNFGFNYNVVQRSGSCCVSINKCVLSYTLLSLYGNVQSQVSVR